MMKNSHSSHKRTPTLNKNLLQENFITGFYCHSLTEWSFSEHIFYLAVSIILMGNNFALCELFSKLSFIKIFFSWKIKNDVLIIDYDAEEVDDSRSESNQKIYLYEGVR